jgi:hypothetical protein
VKAADKSLKKEGASIEKYNPFFFKRFSAQGPRLNMKLFPGIGISKFGANGVLNSLIGMIFAFLYF